MPHPYAGRQPKFGVAQTWLWGWNISLITNLNILPFLGLSPTLPGDNVLLRELKVAVNQTTCPIQNGSYTHLLPSSSPVSTGKTSYAVFSHPSRRAQGELGLQGLREEVCGVGLQARFPLPHGAWGSQSHFLCLVRWSQGPVGKHHCSLLPILPSPLLCSPSYISHDTSSTSTWGGHSFTLGTSPGTQDPSRDLRAKLYSVLHLRGT